MNGQKKEELKKLNKIKQERKLTDDDTTFAAGPYFATGNEARMLINEAQRLEQQNISAYAKNPRRSERVQQALHDFASELYDKQETAKERWKTLPGANDFSRVNA